MLKLPGYACKQINNLKGSHWLLVFARKLWMDRAKAFGVEDQIIR